MPKALCVSTRDVPVAFLKPVPVLVYSGHTYNKTNG